MKIQVLIGILSILGCTLGANGGFCQQPWGMPLLQDSGGAPSPPGPAPSVGPQAWFPKGQAALQAGDLDSAEEAFREVTAADPRPRAAYANLGVIAITR